MSKQIDLRLILIPISLETCLNPEWLCLAIEKTLAASEEVIKKTQKKKTHLAKKLMKRGKKNMACKENNFEKNTAYKGESIKK